MKTFSQLFVLSMLIMSLPVFTSAQGDHESISGNGKIITQDRNVSSFHAIRVNAGMDVELTQGSEVKLQVEADENLMPIIRTEVKDGVLEIYPEKSIRNAKTMKVHLTFKDLDGITANGGCDINSKGKVNLAKLETTLNGGCDIKLDLKVERLSCTHTGGCDAIFTGEASECSFTVSGGSDVEATDLAIGDCTIVATGGSDVDVNVSGALSINAAVASDVTYVGSPSEVSKVASGGSDINGK